MEGYIKCLDGPIRVHEGALEGAGLDASAGHVI